MCGRMTLSAPAEVVEDEFHAAAPPAHVFPPPRYNIAPTQPVAVVRAVETQGVEGAAAKPVREIAVLRWGLVPAGETDTGGPPLIAGARPALGRASAFAYINARAESVATRRDFRESFRRRRCLVPADGFYEWQGKGKSKQAFYLRPAGRRLFAFAGLWDRWVAPDGAPLESFTILTTEPNALVLPIHDRMPVIISRADYDRWLDPAPADPRALQALLRPFPAEAMRAHPVAAWVNDVNQDGPRLIEPAGQELLKL